jgi:WXXGXW repeat (2 copies)
MRVNRLLCLALLILAIPATLFAQLSISITIAPPELVAYSQPSCPQSGYLWTPGYWAYGAEGYYWVPGTWVEPPAVGLLWTPGYWGWVNDGYVWNPGYWGPTVGFYGGINYGYGYSGVGYGGGYWNNGAFYYNRSVNNVNVAIVHNTYVRTVSSPRAGSYVSYNGGPGGTGARPTTAQEAAAHGRHRPATSAQTEHRQAASRNHELLASVNHGKPPIAATSRPGGFTGKGIVAARGAAAEAKADQKKVVASGPTENKVAQKRATTTRPTENKPTTERAVAARTTESRASEKRATTTRPTQNKATTEKAAATHPAESRASEKRATTTRPT